MLRYVENFLFNPKAGGPCPGESHEGQSPTLAPAACPRRPSAGEGPGSGGQLLIERNAWNREHKKAQGEA